MSAAFEEEETAPVLNCPFTKYRPDTFVPLGNHAKKSETNTSRRPRELMLLGTSNARFAPGFLLNLGALGPPGVEWGMKNSYIIIAESRTS